MDGEGRRRWTTRLRAQLLTGPPATSPDEVVDRLLAVQAQDERGFRLAVRSRSSGLVATDVDRALNERRLVVTWLNRGTLHLVRTDDYWWLHPLTAPRMRSGADRRLRQEGVGPRELERGIDVIVGALESDGPLTRNALRIRVGAAGVPTSGQAMVFLLVEASIRGLIVRGPVTDAGHAFASVPSWLGEPPPPLERAEALGRLAERFLAGHEPATHRDLAKWSGLTLGDARLGLDRIGDRIVEVDGGYERRPGDDDAAAEPVSRLLGAFDPILHGWTSRDDVVGHHRGVVTTNGIFRPAALVDGRVVATWRLPSGRVTIDPLERLDAVTRAALAVDGAHVLRFLGLPPTPVEIT